MVRIGVIGAGRAAEQHLGAYRRIDEALVAGVTDTDREAETASARRWETEPLGVEELLETCDIVDICTPTSTHLEYIELAMAAGKGVVCETPLVRSREQIERLREVLREHPRAPVVAAEYGRLAGPLASAASAIEAGGISRPLIARIARRSEGVPESAGMWRDDPQQSGGVILEALSHDVAFLIHYLGRPVRVFAASSSERIDKGEFALITLRFADGSIAHLGGSWLVENEACDEFEIAYRDGLLVSNGWTEIPLRYGLRRNRRIVRLDSSPVAASGIDLGLEELVRRAAAAQPPVPGDDTGEPLAEAIAAVETCLDALESAAAGRPVPGGEGGR